MKRKPPKQLTPKQKISRKINQINFVICGIKENMKTQQRLLRDLGLNSSAYLALEAISKLEETILTISKERKQS